MADRSRRARTRQISEITEDVSEQSASESELDWDPRRTEAARRAGKNELLSNISRVKRSGDDKHQSIRLTMKVAPSRLREVTRANEVDSLQDTLGGGRVIDGPRSRRAAATIARPSVRAAARPRYAEYGESELEEEDEAEDEDEEEAEQDEDEEEEEAEDDEDEATNDFDELGAEAEGGTDDEDVEMADAPPVLASRKQPNQPKPPKITLKPPPESEAKQGAKSKIVVTPAQVGPLKSVEDQEMEDDPGDEEVDEDLSDLSEDNDDDDDEDEEGEDEEEEEEEEEEDEDEEDATNLNEDYAEGEEGPLERPRIAGEEELDDDDELDDDSGDETPASGMATPDPNRLTKRQRGRPEDQGQLMALDMAPQQRKFFTDEEKAMKKDEHARKRKELTKRKITEEKTAALNRLLKPQANKARGAAPKPETLAAATAAAAAEEYEYVERAHPLYTRWVSTKEGVRLGVPDEWLGKKVGRVFGPSVPARNGALIQEVE